MAVDNVVIDRSAAKLRSQTGGARWFRDYLEILAWDHVDVEDDFIGTTLSAVLWTTANSGGAGAASLVHLANSFSGEATMVGGTTDDAWVRAHFNSMQFKGELNAVIAARVKVSAVTTVKLEVGFTDATGDAGAVNILATPTYTASDCALWCFDADDAGNATGWQGIGVKANTGITKLEPTTVNPAADTYQRLVVALRDDNAKYMVFDANDGLIYESAWQASAVTKTVGLTPWLFVQERAGSASRTKTVDQVQVWQRRTLA
jgi:hypothetical protein